MHPRVFAEATPDHAAYIIAETGLTVSFLELEQDANRAAHLFRTLGLVRGDFIAILLENHPIFLKLVWAAQRAGLYFTCISPKLSADEIDYILENSGARLVVASPATREVATEAARRRPTLAWFMMDDAAPPFRSTEAEMAGLPSTPIADESAGEPMLYSSGTTGRPKGIKPPLPPAEQPLLASTSAIEAGAKLLSLSSNSIYLSPAPLYHAAPLGTCMLVQRLGGTVVVLQKFTAESALQSIASYRVTNAQFVPTHFVRMLKLPAALRGSYDVSSLRSAVHAAAPCPVHVKEAMIAWWGPIVDEYYGGTESNGFTFITAREWLQHKGSVGRPMPPSVVHICGNDGSELPPGTEGLVYFSGGREFSYHDDAVKTASVRNAAGWSTMGDVGRLDTDGYLYLCDRKDFMIISGGVNIYPQEIENLLLRHPAIMDAAVFGLPDEEMGERVTAVVQPVDWDAATPALANDILAFVRDAISHVKAPRSIIFRQELPRTATGKLMKRLLREDYRHTADLAAA